MANSQATAVAVKPTIKRQKGVGKKQALSMVVSEQVLEKTMAAMMLASTAAASGMEANVFFTFWGLNALKKGFNPKLRGMMSLGTAMMNAKMKKLGIANWLELLSMARDAGVNLYACNTTLQLFGFKAEDLLDGIRIVGAAQFLKMASEASVQLFIG